MGSSVLQTNIGAQVVNVGASAKNVLTIDALPQLIEALLTAGCDQNCRGVPLPVVGVASPPDLAIGYLPRTQPVTSTRRYDCSRSSCSRWSSGLQRMCREFTQLLPSPRVPGAQWTNGAMENENQLQACSQLARLICAHCNRNRDRAWTDRQQKVSG